MFEADSPSIVELPKTPSKGGVLSFIEEGSALPFKVRRIYWIYDVDKEVERGNHCHEFSRQVLVCLRGEVQVDIANLYEEAFSFKLNHPAKALYLPPKHWLKTKFSAGSILLSATSHLFEEDNTITDYQQFLAMKQY